MAIRKKRESRVQRRYTRSSTKKGNILRRPAHLGKILCGVAVALAVVALALVWGSYLKAESDAYREATERGEWTLDAEIAPPHPTSVPNSHALAIKPEGNVGDILITGSHDGVIMTLSVGDGTLPYTSGIGSSAGLTVAPEAVPLSQDVARVKNRGLRVTCAFAVTCLSAEDSATRTYLRGLELALLREYAAAGMDDLILLGLPAGSDEADRLTMEFLNELRALLSDLPAPPAIGVALPPVCFRAHEVYAGNVSPARMLSACDYIAMDLRAMTAEEVSALLPEINYAYVRYSLRLLTDKNTPAIAEDAISHGFTRVFEMET